MPQPGNTIKADLDAPVVLRPMSSVDDEGYVLKSWVETFHGRRCVGQTDKRGQWRLAQALIQKCPVMMAAHEKNPDTIFGWACTYGADVVNYVFVRKDWRKNGIAAQLLKPYLGRRGIVYTHALSRVWQPPPVGKFNYTSDGNGGKDTVPPIPDGWTYDPYLAFEIAATVPSYQSGPRPVSERVNTRVSDL